MKHEGRSMTFLEHLGELRRRLAWSFGSLLAALPLAWAFRVELFEWVKAPFDLACHRVLGAACPIIYPSPTSGFAAYMALTLTAAAVVALPVIAYQLWAFVAPGLYRHERRVLLPLALGSVLLFLVGAGLCREFVLPRAFEFLLSNSPGEPMIQVEDYLGFLVRLVLVFGLLFELPLVVFVLSAAGLINHRHLLLGWRYFVVAAFALGALLTPPDLGSQFALALSLCGLYVVSIAIAWLVGRKPKGDGVLGLALLVWAWRYGARRRAHSFGQLSSEMQS